MRVACNLERCVSKIFIAPLHRGSSYLWLLFSLSLSYMDCLLRGSGNKGKFFFGVLTKFLLALHFSLLSLFFRGLLVHFLGGKSSPSFRKSRPCLPFFTWIHMRLGQQRLSVQPKLKGQPLLSTYRTCLVIQRQRLKRSFLHAHKQALMLWSCHRQTCATVEGFRAPDESAS